MTVKERYEEAYKTRNTNTLISLWLYSPSLIASEVAEAELERRGICLDVHSEKYLK